jgi:hypothetical protein
VENDPEWWAAPLEFVVHVLVGLFIFVLIGCAAALLDRFVLALGEHGYGEPLLLTSLRAGAYGIFVADMLLFCVYVWKATRRIWARL